MNNKRILFVVSFLMLLAFTFVFLRSSKNQVVVELSENVSSLYIWETDSDNQIISNQPVIELSESDTITLNNGMYSFEPTGERIDESFIFITIEGDTTVVIDPDYSDNFNSNLIKNEKDTILSSIKQISDNILENYTIQEGKLHKKGDWYTTFIQKNKVDPRQENDIYRVVLKKQGDKWDVAAGPELILSSLDYQDIPLDVLSDVNNREINFNLILQ